MNKLEKEDLPIILEAVRDNFTEGKEQMGSLIESLHQEGYNIGAIDKQQIIIQNILRKGLEVNFIADATNICTRNTCN